MFSSQHFSFLKDVWGLLVSGPSYQKLGSLYFLLTTRKRLNTLKNQHLFFDALEKEVTRQTTTVKTEEINSRCRESQPTRTDTCLGNQGQGRDTWTVIDKLLESHYRQILEIEMPSYFEDLVIRRTPYFYKFNLLDIYQFLPWQGEKKRNHFEICKIIMFSLIRFVLGKNSLTKG